MVLTWKTGGLMKTIKMLIFFIKFKQINSNKISNLLLDFLIYESGVSSRWVATVNHSILKKLFVFMVYR
jgi:hypothetical protein